MHAYIHPCQKPKYLKSKKTQKSKYLQKGNILSLNEKNHSLYNKSYNMWKKIFFIEGNFLINGLENLNCYGNASGFLQS